jgi:hypothetical protein
MAILNTVQGINMPSGYTSIGHDLQVSMTNLDGVTLTLANVMSFSWKQETKKLQHMRLNGTTLVADLPMAWSGQIDLQRHDGTMETEFATIQKTWLAAGDYVLGTIVCTVAGSGASTFTFTDCSVTLDDGGTWKGDDVTNVRISFNAAQMTA